MTVKAAYVIEQGNKNGVWNSKPSEEFLGTELEAETVDPDEFCMPEPKKTWDDVAMRQFKERVVELANKSSLREPDSKERYTDIMMRYRDAYTLSLDHFKPGQLDVPRSCVCGYQMGRRLWIVSEN